MDVATGLTPAGQGQAAAQPRVAPQERVARRPGGRLAETRQQGRCAYSTRKLNEPIVEVVVGEHEQGCYEDTVNGSDKYWWSAANAQQEIQRRFKLPDRRWMVVIEVSAEGTGAGGGAIGGWVLLCGPDADGGAGYPAEKARWVGGMVHEVGQAFGLPDSTSTDGTCISASFHGWPNRTFTQSQKDPGLNRAWGSGKFSF